MLYARCASLRAQLAGTHVIDRMPLSCTCTCPGACASALTATSIPISEGLHRGAASYIDALIGDFERELPSIGGRTIETVFFGGGTPSLFRPGGVRAAARARCVG
jgi:hypothetical protein